MAKIKVVVGLLCVSSIWAIVQNRSLSQQVAELTDQVEWMKHELAVNSSGSTGRSDRSRPFRASELVADEAGAAEGRRSRGTSTEEGGAERLEEDPEFRERVREMVSEERRAERQQRHEEMLDAWAEGIDEAVSRFAEAEELDAETEAGVRAALEGVLEEMNALREAVDAEEMSRSEGWRAMREAREESRVVLEELLGEEGAEALQEELRGGF